MQDEWGDYGWPRIDLAQARAPYASLAIAIDERRKALEAAWRAVMTIDEACPPLREFDITHWGRMTIDEALSNLAHLFIDPSATSMPEDYADPVPVYQTYEALFAAACPGEEAIPWGGPLTPTFSAQAAVQRKKMIQLLIWPRRSFACRLRTSGMMHDAHSTPAAAFAAAREALYSRDWEWTNMPPQETALFYHDGGWRCDLTQVARCRLDMPSGLPADAAPFLRALATPPNSGIYRNVFDALGRGVAENEYVSFDADGNNEVFADGEFREPSSWPEGECMVGWRCEAERGVSHEEYPTCAASFHLDRVTPLP